MLRRRRLAIVPVTIELDAEHRTLLISGPNTGGKTVAMKTVGLLCLMAHAGLPVPATEAELPLVDFLLADIGDHQSIEQSLSSFSAHIASVKIETGMLLSDVLIETSGGTDPIACHGHRKGDATTMKNLIERYQTEYYRGASNPVGGTPASR